MKKTILFGLAVAALCYGFAYAITVNPASNVIADSDATAETIILRDASNASTVHTLTVSNAITVPVNSIDTTKVAGTWLLSDLASNSMDSNKVIDGTIYNAEIAASAAIDSSKITGTWLINNLASNSVDSNKILDNSVSLADIRTDAIDTTKLLEATGTTEDAYILCYTNNGKIGRCVDYDGGSDTGKLCSCGAF